MLSEEPNLVDLHRGRPIESLQSSVRPTDGHALDAATRLWTDSKWAVSTRVQYNAWYRSFMAFAEMNGVSAMPAQLQTVRRFLTYIALHYAAVVVGVCAAAIVAVHRANGFYKLLSEENVIKDLLASVKKNGIVGSLQKPFIVDHTFIVAMVTKFLEKYPVFHSSLFDWSRKGKSIIRLRRIALILLGLEIGVRPSSLVAITVCCWRPRVDGSVAVRVIAPKWHRHGKLFEPVLADSDCSFEELPTAVAFFRQFWFPFLASFGGNKVSGKCEADLHGASHCTVCPKLFCTFRGNKPRRREAVHVNEVGKAVRHWAAKLGRESKRYSSKSLRRGSTSIAAAFRVSEKIRRSHGNWRTKKMPALYKELSSREELAVSKSLHKAFRKHKENRAKKVCFSGSSPHFLLRD